ncbi:MAG: hypothetical protein ACE5FU_04770, partial [Nitrospinota bacterium]
SIQTLDQNKEGNVIGFEAKAKIIPYTLEFEAEYDRSRFDFSTDDEFSSTSDTAYIVKIGGKSSIYTYEATYQYSGPDYAVIGNPQALRDRAGILVLAGANTHSHDLHIFASRYFDNVKKDPLFPRVTMYNWALDYSFSGIKSLPFGVGFEQSLLGSALEPTSFEPVQFDTNTASARVSYLRKRWDFRFRTSYSSQNDRSPQENDISSESFTVSPLYQWKNLVIFPNFTFIRTHFDQTKSRTDFFTVTLDLRGETLSEKVTYNLAATFSKGEATNGDLDQRTFSSDFRLSYKLPEKYFGYLAPAAAIRGKYNKTTDYVTNQKNDELTLWLALDANVPFSF